MLESESEINLLELPLEINNKIENKTIKYEKYLNNEIEINKERNENIKENEIICLTNEVNEIINEINVNMRIINMGSDIKFEDDPFNIRLYGIMDPFDYSNSIKKINDELEKCRANSIDHALLTAGPTIIPLIPWAIRQKIRKSKRREIIAKGVDNFNKEHPQLFMRWQTRPEKKLTIMTKSSAIKLMAK